VGVVRDCGPGVTQVSEDDRVVLSWIKGPGIEAGGCKYDWDGRTVNAGGVTTFQNMAVVSENRLAKLIGNIQDSHAVMLGCALPTGIGAVVNVARLGPGDTVAIFGAGGVGQSAIFGALAAGCATIIAVDPNAARRDVALKVGATHAVDPTAGDVCEQIAAIVGGGLDAAIEASGVPAVMEQAGSVVRAQGGRVVVIGNARAGSLLSVDPGYFNQGKSLLGTWGGDYKPERDYPRYARLLASDRIDVSPLLSAPYGLSDINAALDDLESGRVVRPLIKLSSG
jgi:S-(hydroxymethyl)glutathione dehydrogenase/alcohol dehydrogenase